tara:strand:- start:428 stop:607 length:180 start_codon:yes stop_codon:yes gene_type:complete
VKRQKLKIPRAEILDAVVKILKMSRDGFTRKEINECIDILVNLTNLFLSELDQLETDDA